MLKKFKYRNQILIFKHSRNLLGDCGFYGKILN